LGVGVMVGVNVMVGVALTLGVGVAEMVGVPEIVGVGVGVSVRGVTWWYASGYVVGSFFIGWMFVRDMASAWSRLTE
jgi:hypothetical protein